MLSTAIEEQVETLSANDLSIISQEPSSFPILRAAETPANSIPNTGTGKPFARVTRLPSSSYCTISNTHRSAMASTLSSGVVSSPHRQSPTTSLSSRRPCKATVCRKSSQRWYPPKPNSIPPPLTCANSSKTWDSGIRHRTSGLPPISWNGSAPTACRRNVATC